MNNAFHDSDPVVPKKTSLSIDMGAIWEQVADDLHDVESLRDDWMKKTNKKVREEIYRQIVNGSIETGVIVELSVNPDYPLETLGEAVREIGSLAQVYGIGVHGDLLHTLQKKYTDNDNDEDEDIEEAVAFGVPLVKDPRRSRDQVLAVRSEKIWRAYQELLNGSVPTMVQSLLSQFSEPRTTP